MGNEREETAPASVVNASSNATRIEQIVVMGALESRTLGAAIRPAAERIRAAGSASAPACIILTPGKETTSLASNITREILASVDDLRVVPVSAVNRAKRVLASGPVAAVVGTPEDILALRRSSSIRYDNLLAIVAIGLDQLVTDEASETLDAVFSDLPQGVLKTATSASETEGNIENFLSRHLPKNRKVTPLARSASVSISVTPHYRITSRAGRFAALSSFLDDRDPPSLAIIVANDIEKAEAQDALSRLGLIVDGKLVQIVQDKPTGHTAAVIGWSLPEAAADLEAALSGEPIDALFLIEAGDVPVLEALSGGAARPGTGSDIREQAESGAEAIKAAVKTAIESGRGTGAADLALAGSLIESFDPVQVAAAALRLYDEASRNLSAAQLREVGSRGVFAQAAQAVATAAATAVSGDKVRLFFNIGKRDNVRPGDLLGAIAGESGIPGDRIGSIDIFESHSLVEIARESSQAVISKLTGVTLRGRQLHVRQDDRASGGHGGFSPSRSGGDRDRGRSSDRNRTGGGGRSFDRSGSGGGRSFDRPSGGGRSFDRPSSGGGGRSFSRDGGGQRSFSRGPSRDGASGGGGRGGFSRPQSGDAARRAYIDRAPSERTEARREWSARGEQLSRSTRPPRSNDQRSGQGGGRPPLPFRKKRDWD